MTVIGWKIGKTTPVIGVDVGRQSVKLVQYDRPGPKGKVVAKVRQPMPAGVSLDDESYSHWLATAVKSALAKGTFSGRRCVSSLPSAAVDVKNLRLPRMPADELREAVDWEIRDRLKLKPEEATVQFLNAGEVRQGEELREEVIALTAKARAIESHADALCEAGLTPVAVEVAVTALARACGSEQASGVSVVIDVGYESSKVMIVRDGQVVFFKLIEIAGAAFDQSVSQHLSMPLEETQQLRRDYRPDEAATPHTETAQRALSEALRSPLAELSREVELCLRYFGVTFRGERPDKLVLVGGEAGQPWLPDMLSQQIGLDVTVGNPTGQIAGGGPEWAVATGLAMRSEDTWGNRRQSERGAA